MSRSEKLLQAALLLDEVRADLDTTSETCTCCGLDKKKNWSEAQLANSLKEAAKKIRRYADIAKGPYENRTGPS